MGIAANFFSYYIYNNWIVNNELNFPHCKHSYTQSTNKTFILSITHAVIQASEDYSTLRES